MAVVSAQIAPFESVPASHLAALGAVTDTSNSSSPCTVFEVCIDAAMNLCSWRLAQVIQRDRAQRNLFLPACAWKLRGDERRDELTCAIEQGRKVEHDGLLTRIVHSRRPVAWDQINPMPGEAWLQAASDQGLVSTAAFPVLSGSDVVAVFELYSDQRAKLGSPLMELFRLMAIQAGRSVERSWHGCL